MVAFKIRVLILSSKQLSPYRRVSVICKSFLSKMLLLMLLIVFRKVNHLRIINKSLSANLLK